MHGPPLVCQPADAAPPAGAAGAWFLSDYANYGNTLSLLGRLKGVDAHVTLEAKLAWTLGICCVRCHRLRLAVLRMDRIGHKRLQLVGFTVMAAAFSALGGFPADSDRHTFPPRLRAQLLLCGIQTDTQPSSCHEVFPVSMRTTGHGIAAGVGKLGAFIGVFLVPQLQKHIGLRGMFSWLPVRPFLGSR